MEKIEELNKLIKGVCGSNNYMIAIFAEASTSDDARDHISFGEYEKNYTDWNPWCTPITRITWRFDFWPQFTMDGETYIRSELLEAVDTVARRVACANKRSLE